MACHPYLSRGNSVNGAYFYVMTLLLVGGLLAALAVGALWVVSSMVNNKRSNPIIDLDVQDKAAGFISTGPQLHATVGKMAVAATDLRPQGFITIDEKRFDAQSEGGEFYERGTIVVVAGIIGQFLVVRKYFPPAEQVQLPVAN
jgi:membrane-bound ClpP family serine protease